MPTLNRPLEGIFQNRVGKFSEIFLVPCSKVFRGMGAQNCVTRQLVKFNFSQN